MFESIVDAISGSAWSYAIIFGVAAVDAFAVAERGREVGEHGGGWERRVCGMGGRQDGDCNRIGAAGAGGTAGGFAAAGQVKFL